MREDRALDGETGGEFSAPRGFLQGNSPAPYRALLLTNLLGKLMDRVTAQQVREVADLSLAQWRVMANIDLLGRCRASEIVSAALTDRAEVSRAVNALETRGLVQRTANPRHRQSNLISLTEAGTALHEKVRGERVKYFELWLTDLDKGERDALEVSLNTIIHRILESVPDALNA